jgi:diketogulonate reductase-like aldo/keto reductase
MKQRAIPSTGEMLPIVGLGTYRGFDVGINPSERERLTEVLNVVLAQGRAMIDSSPMYGRAEDVTGRLLQDGKLDGHAFLATKVWTSGKGQGIAQMEKSLKLLRTDKLDLMQVHNLMDVNTHLATLKDWKAQGRVRYVGVTHYHSGAYGALEAVMRKEKLDFVQLNYSLDDREAEERLLPLAQDRGIAIIVNLPFGGGGLIGRMSKQPLPPFAKEIGAASWGQILLKFVLGHPAVTVAIPGTGNPKHMAENVTAADGDLASGRERILAWAKNQSF